MADEHLFREMNTARYGDNRRHKSLFLPKLVEKLVSHKQITDNEAFKTAHEIFCKWADLEDKGKLKHRTESNLEGEFVTEVFGKALGYSVFSDDKDNWELEQKYTVDGGEVDAVLGLFQTHRKKTPHAVIELKGPTVNVDRDKSNGRTPVDQCWDYLYALPNCEWGIVCNFVSFRLYHRNQTKRTYELFTLQSLKNKDVFRKFYVIFQRDGILPTKLTEARVIDLLEKSSNIEKEVGDELYKYYHDNRIQLIQYLTSDHQKKTLETAIHIAQKIIDRIIFIAFCEDRGLLPVNSLKTAWEQVPPFARVVNPKWQNFLSLFQSIDKGNETADISPFNGGLFRADPEVDNLELDDSFTNFFKHIGGYDFKDEINVDVLGHLFERSVNDIERIKFGGMFGEEIKTDEKAVMSKSAERKRFGIYYTPSNFTEFIAYNTIYKLAVQRFDKIAQTMKLKREEAETAQNDPQAAGYWKECFNAIRDLKIVDPACGSGAFLIKAYDVFEELYLEVLNHLEYQGKKIDVFKGAIPDFILNENIHGMDLSSEAVEITQLALWIRSAHKGKTLADLSKNIICGNSLIDDLAVDAKAKNWKTTFPQVFERDRPGFDCVIGNPPWERMNIKKREFFAFCAPEVIAASTAAESREFINNLEKNNPSLYKRWIDAKNNADKTIEYVRKSKRYPLTAKGDINTYSVFAELARTIVAPNGLVGLLVPSGIATDSTTKDFFATLVKTKVLAGLFDFENKAPVFTDVHRSFKFSILLFGGERQTSETIDFVFFAHRMEELKDSKRYIKLIADDIKTMNPNTLTCPVFRSPRDADITKKIYREVPILIDEKRKLGGNPWGIRYMLMFHQFFDAKLFQTLEQIKKKDFKRDGEKWKKGKQVLLPLYEAKMIQMYDHHAASVVIDETNWMRQGQTVTTSSAQHQNPEFIVEPRWWIEKRQVDEKLENYNPLKMIAFKNVTSPTNERTMIAAFVPPVGVVHSAPIIFTGDEITARQTTCLLANLNSLIFDYVCRQKIGGVNLSYFIINQLPAFSPDKYADFCPWDKKKTLEAWISERVLKLTCTSNDMVPLAKEAGFKPGVHKWKDTERRKLMAELDAAFFHLYGIKRDDVSYILSTFSGVAKEGDIAFGDTTESLILNYYDQFIKMKN
ncbi:MAG: N-6 DNA methylase [Phycisphaerae bacterium]|nr:N-6 DNA methylase [Phycisphaerae bacterium]